MHPIAFSIFGKEIHWYGICIMFGFLVATGIMLWKRDRAKMSFDQIIDMAILALFSGVIGARIFFVIQYWDSHFAGRNFLEVFRIDKGGLVFYGGFILAFVAVCWYAKRKKISIPAILDVAAPAMAAAHGFGRIGCFMQGCCFGKPAPADCAFAVHFPWTQENFGDFSTLNAGHGTTFGLYPTQLMESAGNFLICIVLLLLFKRFRKPGQIAGIYMILYAVMRFSIEFIRGDNGSPLTTSQNIALFLMAPLGALLLLFAKSNGEKHA